MAALSQRKRNEEEKSKRKSFVRKLRTEEKLQKFGKDKWRLEKKRRKAVICFRLLVILVILSNEYSIILFHFSVNVNTS